MEPSFIGIVTCSYAFCSAKLNQNNEGLGLPQYKKYTTTVIGAHSVPRWYEPLDQLVSAGRLHQGISGMPN